MDEYALYCAVCEGEGDVRHGFYSVNEVNYDALSGRVLCPVHHVPLWLFIDEDPRLVPLPREDDEDRHL
jgi:hypothetical protein